LPVGVFAVTAVLVITVHTRDIPSACDVRRAIAPQPVAP